MTEFILINKSQTKILSFVKKKSTHKGSVQIVSLYSRKPSTSTDLKWRLNTSLFFSHNIRWVCFLNCMPNNQLRPHLSNGLHPANDPWHPCQILLRCLVFFSFPEYRCGLFIGPIKGAGSHSERKIVQHDYLGLQTPPDGRPHVVDGNHNVSLHAHAQRENHLPLLDSVFSGDGTLNTRKKHNSHNSRIRVDDAPVTCLNASSRLHSSVS